MDDSKITTNSKEKPENSETELGNKSVSMDSTQGKSKKSKNKTKSKNQKAKSKDKTKSDDIKVESENIVSKKPEAKSENSDNEVQAEIPKENPKNDIESDDSISASKNSDNPKMENSEDPDNSENEVNSKSSDSSATEKNSENKLDSEDSDNKEENSESQTQSEYSKVKKFRQKVKIAIKKEDWRTALKLFDQMISVRPTAERYCNRSFILLQLGKLGAALESYDRALGLDSNCEVARRGIKKVETMLQDLKVQSSNKEIEDTIVDTEKNEKAASMEFGDHVKQKNWGAALHVLNKHIQQKPSCQRFCNQGFLFMQLGELEKAQHSYKLALQLDADFKSAQKGLKKVQKMILNVQQGTKEEPMLSFQLEPQPFLSPSQIVAIALVIFALLVLILWPNKTEKVNVGKTEVEQRDGLILVGDKWMTPQQKFATEQQEKGLVLVDDQWMTPQQKFVAEQQEKGLVLVDDKWMTPQQKFATEQQEKGLVLVDDKWMTPQQKFATEQQEKGLVLVDDKWMTPQQKFATEQQEKGLVLVDDKWMTPQQKFATEQQEKGLVLVDDKWMTPQQKIKEEKILKKIVQKKTKTYHDYLLKRCIEAEKIENFSEAYNLILHQTKTFSDYLQINSDSSIVEQERKRNPKRKCYIFPFELFTDHDSLKISLENSKETEIREEIVNLETKFADIITEKSLLEKEHQDISDELENKKNKEILVKNDIDAPNKLKRDIAELNNKISEREKRIENSASDLINSEQKLASLTSKIRFAAENQRNLERKFSFNSDSKESEIRDLEEKIEDNKNLLTKIDRDIKNVKKELQSTPDKDKKKLLQRELDGLEREEKNAEKNNTAFRDRIDNFQDELNQERQDLQESRSKILNLENEEREVKRKVEQFFSEKEKLRKEINEFRSEIDNSKSRMSSLEKNIPSKQQELKEIQQQIGSMSERKNFLKNTINAHQNTLQPLYQLYDNLRKSEDSLKKYQRWWSNLEDNKESFSRGKHPIENSRRNLLLSLFILEHFSPKYYQIEPDKTYRMIGIVNIIFQ